MNRSSLITIIIILLCIACNSDNETTTSAVEVDLQPKDSAEMLPYFEVTTPSGKITSNELLADSNPEFFLFISPN